MIDSLSAVRAGIHHGAKTAVRNSQFSGKFRHDVNKNVRGKVFVSRREVRDALNVFFRDNQHVHECLRVQILERDNKIIFKDFLRGNFARRNFAEDTIAHVKTSLYNFLCICFGDIHHCTRRFLLGYVHTKESTIMTKTLNLIAPLFIPSGLSLAEPLDKEKFIAARGDATSVWIFVINPPRDMPIA